MRLFLPALYGPSPPTSVTDAHMEALYEHIIRPAVGHADRRLLANWPGDYESERFRATKDEGGRVVRTNRIVPKEAGYAFFQSMFDKFRHEIEGMEFATGAFFAMEVRGIKDATRHRVPRTIADTRTHRSWHEAFNFVNLSLVNSATVEAYVDVAFEVGLPGHSLAWKKSSHRKLMAKSTGYSEAACQAVMRNGNKHFTDLTGLLYEVAGFRTLFGNANVEDEPTSGVIKLNVYTTDKASTALTDSGRYAKFLSFDKVLTPSLNDEDPASRVREWLAGMNHVFDTAIEKGIDGKARFEARMKYHKGIFGLTNMSLIDFIKDHLIAIESVHWWSVLLQLRLSLTIVDLIPRRTYRSLRMTGCAGVVMDSLALPPLSRLSLPSLLLSAVAGWMIAALNARPQDWADHKRISTACLPVMRNAETDDLVAVRTGGTFYIHRIEAVAGETEGVRCRSDPQLPTSVARLFGYRSINEVREALTTLQRHQNAAARIAPTVYARQNTHASVTDREPVSADDESHGDFFAFKELELISDEVAHRVEIHWQKLWVEILAKVPNEGSRGSWLTEDMLLGSRKHFGAFLEPTDDSPISDYLYTVFRKYQYRVAMAEQWNAAFECLFPPPGWVKGPHTSGYGQMSSFDSFNTFLGIQEQAVPGNAAIIRAALKKRFNTLRWAPAATISKLWKSGNIKVSGWIGTLEGPLVYVHYNPTAIEP